MASVALAGRQLRRSTLLSRNETKPTPVPALKEKPQRNERGRRSLTKKRPVKGARVGATCRVSRAVTYKGRLYTIGDIVAFDTEEEGPFYGQITGLLTDPYGEKSASLAWLVPTNYSSDVFDPSTFVFGESDDTPRKLDKLRYVTHVQPDHFKSGVSRI